MPRHCEYLGKMRDAELHASLRGLHIMGMPQPIADWTVERVLALPDDGNRYEVVDGELLVSPAPTLLHQRAIILLLRRLEAYVDAHQVGNVLVSPADIEFDQRTLVQPDLFVAPLVEGRRPRSWKEIRQLLLAVEVLSPSTARADRQVKRRRYQRHGVGEYWIVDLEARLVECWTPSDQRPLILTDRLEWRPFGESGPQLSIDLIRFFGEALDD